MEIEVEASCMVSVLWNELPRATQREVRDSRMTVGKLIAALEKFPASAVVVLHEQDDDGYGHHALTWRIAVSRERQDKIDARYDPWPRGYAVLIEPE